MSTQAVRYSVFEAGFAKVKADAVSATYSAPTALIREVYLSYHITVEPRKSDPADTTTGEKRMAYAREGLHRIIVAVGASAQVRSSGEPTNLDNLRRWKTWIGTMSRLVLQDPGQSDRISSGVKEIPEALVARIIEFRHVVRDFGVYHSGAKPANINVLNEHQLTQLAVGLAADLGIPSYVSLTQVQWISLAKAGQELARASYYALIVYLCGRPVGAHTDAISIKRPQNLEAKFNNKIAWAEVSGDVRMSPGTWEAVGQTWEIDPEFRCAYFIPLVGLGKGATDTTLSVIATMVGLLEMAQMSHIKIINDFLKTYPWAAELEGISLEILTLSVDMEVWLSYPAPVRPYAKLLYRDQFKAFDSKTLRKLIALAVDVLSQSQSTLNQYAIRTTSSEVRASFDRELAHRGGPAMAPRTVVPVTSVAPVVV